MGDDDDDDDGSCGADIIVVGGETVNATGRCCSVNSIILSDTAVE